jgi:hypothetical protein
VAATWMSSQSRIASLDWTQCQSHKKRRWKLYGSLKLQRVMRYSSALT